MTTLYIDESKSKGYTIVTAAIVTAEIGAMRKEIAKLRKNGQNRVHFVSESPARRREILAVLVSLGLTARIYHAERMKEPEAREKCLARVVADATQNGVTKIVLERDASVEQFDRRVLYREIESNRVQGTIQYSHDTAKNEPLLWIPDAIAWSFARGGEWKTRIKPLIINVTDVGH